MVAKDKQTYLNASVILCGAVCLLRMIAYFVYQAQDWNKPALIPGLSFLTGLCYPVLFAWIGMLIRGLCRECKWWVQLFVAVVSILCLLRYCTWTADHWFSLHLDLVMVGLGFLMPPSEQKLEEKKTGWMTLVMLILTGVCYTAVAIIKQRLDWTAVMPEHPDMETLLENISRVIEPLLIILTAYLAILFSFTSAAQKIGSNRWVRIIAIVACVFSFLQALRFVLLTSFKWQYLAGNIYYYPLKYVLAQPITIYLVYVSSRAIAEVGKPKEERESVKELFKIL